MKITKYYAPWSVFWGPQMKDKYGFESYKKRFDRNEPVVVFGCYGGGTKQDIMNHQGLVIVVWSGSDSTRLHEMPTFVQYCKENEHRVFHIAHSHWIQVDLAHFGIKYIDRVVIPIKSESYQYEEECGDSVYHYGTHQREWYYGTTVMKELQKKWAKNRHYPNVIFTTQAAYKPAELYDVYKKCFIGVRLTEHDNMAMSAVEMGLMGRRTIFNGDVPCAIPYPCVPYTTYEPLTRKRLVWQKERELEGIIGKMILDYKYYFTGPDKELAEEMQEFCYDDRAWLDTKFYE